jgi:zinc transporter, ZIP family
MAVALACVTFFSTGIGGVAAIRFRDRLHVLLGFSAGAVLGVVFFDVLPEAFSLGPPRQFMVAAAVGFLAFFGLERYTALHRGREHEHAAAERLNHEQELGVLGAAGLSVHSFLDGVAIGVAFQASTVLGLVVALAVIAHDFDDGLNTVTVLLAHGNQVGRARRWLLVDMTTPILGAASTYLFHVPVSVLPWILAFFAGFFLYIGASDLLPEAREHDSPLVGLATALGLAVIFIVTRAMP